MRNLPRITVVTPSYNQGRYLEETILSVIEQRYPNLEYIIIDGGSTDESVGIIKKYSDHINYWITESDGGQSHAINKGLRKATGDVVCWLNSDDIFLPCALLNVGNAFVRNPGADLVLGHTLFVDSDLHIIKCIYNLTQFRFLTKYGVIAFSQQSMYWRKTLLERVGYLDESLHACMDIDLWVRFIKVGARIKRIRKYCAAWRLHKECKSIKHNGFSKIKKEYRDMTNSKNRSSSSMTIWERDREVMNLRYKSIRYGNEAKWALVLYRLGKLLYGDYFRDIMFRAKWQGKPLQKFRELL